MEFSLFNINTKMISSNFSYLGANLICEGFVVKMLLSENWTGVGVFTISTDENHSFIVNILTQSSFVYIV